MSTPDINSGDTAQAALLARFSRQPAMLMRALPRERPRPRRLPPPVAQVPQTAPILNDTERRAALQLRAVWLAFTDSKSLPAGESDYEIWRGACRLAHLSPLLCADVICTGFTLDEADARYKMQSGTAKDNMHRCLAIFTMQNG